MSDVRERFHGQEARAKILEGVDAVADAVKATMGAKGRTVFTSHGHATKDGVTVARDIELFEDRAAAHGAKLIKEASVRTCDKAGDGTTTVCVIAQSLIREGMRLIGQGKDPQDLKRELESKKEAVLSALKAQQTAPTSLLDIASVSANDAELGKLVASAVETVGADGLVTVEKTYGAMEIEVAGGMQLDRGMLPGPYLTDAEKRRAEYDDASVLLFSGKIHDLQGFAKAVEPIVKEGKPLLIVADEYDLPVIRSLELTSIKGMGRFVPIRSANIYHDETFQDLAAFTGATVLTEADSFKNFSPDLLGRVKKVISTPEKTTLRCADDRLPFIEQQVAAIREHAKGFVESEKRNVEKRASRLQGKMAVVKLPETTEAEGKEIRDRVEDAIFACQAALEMGVVPGGGYAYAKAGQFESWVADDGIQILRTALQAPMKQILKNAGQNEARISGECLGTSTVFNVNSGLFEPIGTTTIVDPLKVTLTAFENALSVALVALTTEVVIADRQVKD